jgi:hypothetical protein
MYLTLPHLSHSPCNIRYRLSLPVCSSQEKGAVPVLCPVSPTVPAIYRQSLPICWSLDKMPELELLELLLELLEVEVLL